MSRHVPSAAARGRRRRPPRASRAREVLRCGAIPRGIITGDTGAAGTRPARCAISGGGIRRREKRHDRPIGARRPSSSRRRCQPRRMDGWRLWTVEGLAR
jgi:hypothetical protein